MTQNQLPASAYASALAGVDDAEAYFEDSAWSSAQLEDGSIQEIDAGSQRGLGLRLLRRGLLPTTAAPPAFSRAIELASVYQTPPSDVALADKIGLLQELDRLIRAEFPLIRQATIRCGDRVRRTRVLNADGSDVGQSLVSTFLSIPVVAEENGRLQTGYEILGAQRGWELMAEGAPAAAARRAAARALAKLRAPKAKAGEMPVVLSSSAGGTFIHEAIGHSLEVDHVQEGSSPVYRGAIGRKIASDDITVIDDPTLPGQRGSYFFDDEGVPAAPTTLVERGVLTGYLYDRTTALRDGRASNGHGRRESFRDRVFPRMSNLYIAPGPDDPARIAGGLERGLFVTRMGGGQVNTATGEFVFEVDEGFCVEDGQIKHQIRDANLLGIGPECLRSIDRVGWDIGWGGGNVRKGRPKCSRQRRPAYPPLAESPRRRSA